MWVKLNLLSILFPVHYTSIVWQMLVIVRVNLFIYTVKVIEDLLQCMYVQYSVALTWKKSDKGKVDVMMALLSEERGNS